MTALTERLGYPPDAKLLIVTCDDLGSSRAANVAVYEALRCGSATTASLMVPCAWARDAADRYRGEDVGVHLTLTAEWESRRWGPITDAPSLRTIDGAFPRTNEQVWRQAKFDDVRKEGRAQIERALAWGIDLTHLDSHMLTLQLREGFFDVYLELAVGFGLPVRMIGGARAERVFGFAFRRRAEAAGVLFPDSLLFYPGIGIRPHLERVLRDLPVGVTEVFLHPAADTAELRASHPDWAGRVDDFMCLITDRSLPDLVERAGATLIGFRELREAQRAGRGGQTESGD